MKYVYILHSTEFPDRYYVGVTSDLKSRLAKHNAGEVSHTSKYLPWSLKTYLAFSDEAATGAADETFLEEEEEDGGDVSTIIGPVEGEEER